MNKILHMRASLWDGDGEKESKQNPNDMSGHWSWLKQLVSTVFSPVLVIASLNFKPFCPLCISSFLVGHIRFFVHVHEAASNCTSIEILN